VLRASINTVANNLTAETKARQTADSRLQDDIDDEVAARAAADSAESAARQNADNTLQGNITAEATARQNADNTLQGNIEAEATTRLAETKFATGEQLSGVSIETEPMAGSNKLVKSGGVYNFLSEYAVIYDSVPSLSTSDNTFTLPSGSVLYTKNGRIEITYDIIWTRAEGLLTDYAIEFLILNTSDKTHRVVNYTEFPTCSDDECIVALVDFNSYVIACNSRSYHVNGKLCKNYSEDVIKDYAGVSSAVPLLDTENRTFTLPAGTFITSSRYSNNVTLSEAITWTRNNYGQEFIILNLSTLEYRSARYLSTIALNDYEVVIALVRWASGVLSSNFDSYYLNQRYVDMKHGIGNITQIESSGTTGYWNSNGISVGDVLSSVPPFVSTNQNFVSANFCAKAGTTLYISGVSGTVYSRLYFIVRQSDGVVTHKASSGADLRDANVATIHLDADSDVYLSYPKSTDSTAYRSWYAYDADLISRVTVLENNNSAISAPCMYNPPFDVRKTNLKVLDIGNSYTRDCTQMLPLLVESAGVDVSDMSLYRAIMGGSSFKTWYNKLKSAIRWEYAIEHVVGATQSVTTGSTINDGNTAIIAALTDVKWDVIVIHQLSTYANSYDQWLEKGAGGYLRELVLLLKTLQPQAAIGTLLTHSYWSGYEGNTEGSSLLRWKNVANSTKKFMSEYGLDFVVPYGTAMQNLRASSQNNDYDLTRDGTHSTYGLGRYVDACTYYQFLIAPRTGVGIVGNSARYTVPESEIAQATYPTIDVTDSNALVAQKAAMLATCNMFEVVNPDDVDL